jgi:cyclophilin family peptidyl-prolyl cis-trans isomerase
MRGAVGLSTRGRNTADGQFYIMLVDDPRLNHEYTIFAQVFNQDMDVVDRIEEGDRISTIRSISCQ